MSLATVRQEAANRFQEAQTFLSAIKVLEQDLNHQKDELNVRKGLFLVLLYGAFEYSLTRTLTDASATRAPRKAGTQAPKRQARDLPCPICEFKTTPHHDGRMHRSQKTKKPFTVEELMEKGLTKVG